MSNFKHRNRGMITLGIVGLSAVAITATGFAAWVISGTGTKEVSGNIQVDTVTNSNHEVAVSLDKNSIYFGKASSGTTASWLTNDSSETESLTFTATVEVSNVQTAPAAASEVLANPTLAVKKDSTDITSTTWASIADGSATTAGVGGATANPDGTKGLVGALPTLTYSNTSYEGTKYTAKIVVTFTWGQLFGSQNPQNYYASNTVTEKGAEAQARLEALHTALDGATYVLTVTSK